MIKNKFGELVLTESDLCDLVMQGQGIECLSNITVDSTVNFEKLVPALEDPSILLTWQSPSNDQLSIAEFDSQKQSMWHMPESYKDLDIAEYVLSLCNTQAQLQRVGEELLLFQERKLFDLLRYLKYLVDVMTKNHVIWGVGRGSSVASYVLYLLGVHRIDSMFYELDPREFLR